MSTSTIGSVMQLTIEEQTMLAKKYADEAFSNLKSLLIENEEVIKRRMLLRIAVEGLAQYGDATWFRDPSELLAECIDELADGVFYLIPLAARRSGEHLTRTPRRDM